MNYDLPQSATNSLADTKDSADLTSLNLSDQPNMCFMKDSARSSHGGEDDTNIAICKPLVSSVNGFSLSPPGVNAFQAAPSTGEQSSFLMAPCGDNQTKSAASSSKSLSPIPKPGEFR